MLNDWESALADNTSKDLFSNKFEEEICRSSKTKTKSKDVFKSIASSNRPISWGPLAQMRWQGVAKENLPLASKILTSPLVRNLSLPTAKNLPALRDLPQVHPLEISLFPQDLVPVPTGRKVKVFSEKLGETVQRPSCTKYDIGLQGTLFGSTLSKKIPESSTNVQGEICQWKQKSRHSQKKGQSK